MAKKSMKEAAAAGTSVFGQIASGNAENAQDAQNAKNVQGGRPAKYTGQLERLNLKLPAELKEYLAVAAARVSIAERRSVSITEYLIELIKADKEKNNEA